jgi:hypothetical protein
MTDPMNILADWPPANLEGNPHQGKELPMQDRLKNAGDAIASSAYNFNVDFKNNRVKIKP